MCYSLIIMQNVPHPPKIAMTDILHGSFKGHIKSSFTTHREIRPLQDTRTYCVPSPPLNLKVEIEETGSWRNLKDGDPAKERQPPSAYIFGLLFFFL